MTQSQQTEVKINDTVFVRWMETIKEKEYIFLLVKGHQKSEKGHLYTEHVHKAKNKKYYCQRSTKTVFWESKLPNVAQTGTNAIIENPSTVVLTKHKKLKTRKNNNSSTSITPSTPATPGGALETPSLKAAAASQQKTPIIKKIDKPAPPKEGEKEEVTISDTIYIRFFKKETVWLKVKGKKTSEHDFLYKELFDPKKGKVYYKNMGSKKTMWRLPHVDQVAKKPVTVEPIKTMGKGFKLKPAPPKVTIPKITTPATPTAKRTPSSVSSPLLISPSSPNLAKAKKFIKPENEPKKVNINNTPYLLSHVEGKDYYVPVGKTFEDKDFVWIKKMDTKRNRAYYVNKRYKQSKWKLPRYVTFDDELQIYDSKTMSLPEPSLDSEASSTVTPKPASDVDTMSIKSEDLTNFTETPMTPEVVNKTKQNEKIVKSSPNVSPLHKEDKKPQLKESTPVVEKATPRKETTPGKVLSPVEETLQKEPIVVNTTTPSTIPGIESTPITEKSSEKVEAPTKELTPTKKMTPTKETTNAVTIEKMPQPAEKPIEKIQETKRQESKPQEEKVDPTEHVVKRSPYAKQQDPFKPKDIKKKNEELQKKERTKNRVEPKKKEVRTIRSASIMAGLERDPFTRFAFSHRAQVTKESFISANPSDIRDFRSSLLNENADVGNKRGLLEDSIEMDIFYTEEFRGFGEVRVLVAIPAVQVVSKGVKVERILCLARDFAGGYVFFILARVKNKKTHGPIEESHVVVDKNFEVIDMKRVKDNVTSKIILNGCHITFSAKTTHQARLINGFKYALATYPQILKYQLEAKMATNEFAMLYHPSATVVNDVETPQLYIMQLITNFPQRNSMYELLTKIRNVSFRNDAMEAIIEFLLQKQQAHVESMQQSLVGSSSSSFVQQHYDNAINLLAIFLRIPGAIDDAHTIYLKAIKAVSKEETLSLSSLEKSYIAYILTLTQALYSVQVTWKGRGHAVTMKFSQEFISSEENNATRKLKSYFQSLPSTHLKKMMPSGIHVAFLYFTDDKVLMDPTENLPHYKVENYPIDNFATFSLEDIHFESLFKLFGYSAITISKVRHLLGRPAPYVPSGTTLTDVDDISAPNTPPTDSFTGFTDFTDNDGSEIANNPVSNLSLADISILELLCNVFESEPFSSMITPENDEIGILFDKPINILKSSSTLLVFARRFPNIPKVVTERDPFEKYSWTKSISAEHIIYEKYDNIDPLIRLEQLDESYSGKRWVHNASYYYDMITDDIEKYYQPGFYVGCFQFCNTVVGTFSLVQNQHRNIIPMEYVQDDAPSAEELQELVKCFHNAQVNPFAEGNYIHQGEPMPTTMTLTADCESIRQKFIRGCLRLVQTLRDGGTASISDETLIDELGNMYPHILTLDQHRHIKAVVFIREQKRVQINLQSNQHILWRKLSIVEPFYLATFHRDVMTHHFLESKDLAPNDSSFSTDEILRQRLHKQNHEVLATSPFMHTLQYQLTELPFMWMHMVMKWFIDERVRDHQDALTPIDQDEESDTEEEQFDDKSIQVKLTKEQLDLVKPTMMNRYIDRCQSILNTMYETQYFEEDSASNYELAQTYISEEDMKDILNQELMLVTPNKQTSPEKKVEINYDAIEAEIDALDCRFDEMANISKTLAPSDELVCKQLVDDIIESSFIIHFDKELLFEVTDVMNDMLDSIEKHEIEQLLEKKQEFTSNSAGFIGKVRERYEWNMLKKYKSTLHEQNQGEKEKRKVSESYSSAIQNMAASFGRSIHRATNLLQTIQSVQDAVEFIEDLAEYNIAVEQRDIILSSFKSLKPNALAQTSLPPQLIQDLVHHSAIQKKMVQSFQEEANSKLVPHTYLSLSNLNSHNKEYIEYEKSKHKYFEHTRKRLVKPLIKKSHAITSGYGSPNRYVPKSIADSPLYSKFSPRSSTQSTPRSSRRSSLYNAHSPHDMLQVHSPVHDDFMDQYIQYRRVKVYKKKKKKHV